MRRTESGFAGACGLDGQSGGDSVYVDCWTGLMNILDCSLLSHAERSVWDRGAAETAASSSKFGFPALRLALLVAVGRNELTTLQSGFFTCLPATASSAEYSHTLYLIPLTWFYCYV